MLTVNFKRNGSKVYMQILEQTDIERGCGVVFEDGELSICSSVSPEIERRTLWVRGVSRDYDDKVSCCSFFTPEEADKYIDSMVTLVKKYNQSYAKWQNTNYTESVDQVLVVGDPDLLLIKIIRDDTDVVIRILEQNDDEIERGQGLLYHAEMMELKTTICVMTDWHTLWIKGIDDSDNKDITCVSFDTETKAKQYVKNVTELIEGFVAEHKRTKCPSVIDREVIAE